MKKGDWGFKRPLPLRSTTRTSTPIIRVKAIDTWEQVTEFGSAADHSLTLKKWHEMGVPLTIPITTNTSATGLDTIIHRSVFEDDIDTTAPKKEIGGKDGTRWKFNGPWLAGQTEGEFQKYIQEDVQKRKGEFAAFLRKSCANATNKAAIQRAREQGDEFPEPLQAIDITDAQFMDYVKNLRQETKELYRQVRAFLDLPPPPKVRNTTLCFDAAAAGSSMQEEVFDSPYAEFGPPKTHPSAGLAYSRTDAITFNHPIYGPQRQKPPVEARIVMPNNTIVGAFAPVLGVGGVVVDIPNTDTFRHGSSVDRRNQKQTIPGLIVIEPGKVGGSKTYVEPQHARIDQKGRIILQVGTADEEVVAVKEGRVGEIPVDIQREYRQERPQGYARPTGSSEGYGLSWVTMTLPDVGKS